MGRMRSPGLEAIFFISLLFISPIWAQMGFELTPEIYIASENSGVVQFTCTKPSPDAIILFTVDDTRTSSVWTSRGITEEVNETASVLTIQPLLRNNGSVVECFNFDPSAVLTGSLLVQGRLSAPPSLVIKVGITASFRLLCWTPPFTLDITDQKEDIIGYRVCITPTAPETSLGCVSTPDLSYPYLNVHLLLQLSVTPINVVGDGMPIIVTHQPCPRGQYFTSCLDCSEFTQ